MYFENFDSFGNKAVYNLANIVKIAEKKDKGVCYLFTITGDFFSVKLSIEELINALQKSDYFKKNFIRCTDDYKSFVFYNKENICLFVEKQPGKVLIFAKDGKKHFIHNDYQEIKKLFN